MLKISVGTLVGLQLFSFYNYPELRNDPLQFLKAQARILRLSTASLYMAYTYKTETNISIAHEKSAKVLRDAIERNGGVYLKFGQQLASLDIIVPDEYRKLFKALLENCPEYDFETTRRTIETSLKDKLENVYKQFDPKPISSASIAQVHKATLHSGETVAVKVQHPDLKKQCSGDIELITILMNFAKIMFPEFKLGWLGEEIRENLPKELDFEQEISNSNQTKELFKNLGNVHIPYIYQNFSSQSVITMEWIDGISLADPFVLREQGYSLSHLANVISEVFNLQIFKHGFVHADPHQGNLFARKVQKNGKTIQQIVLLDHGLYKIMSPQLMKNYTDLWVAILNKDHN